VYSAQLCGELQKEKVVKERGSVQVWVQIGPNHFLDCAYLSTAAADFVLANEERLTGKPRKRKSASDYMKRARASATAAAYAGRPVIGMMGEPRGVSPWVRRTAGVTLRVIGEPRGVSPRIWRTVGVSPWVIGEPWVSARG
jgi:hypothetical protein